MWNISKYTMRYRVAVSQGTSRQGTAQGAWTAQRLDSIITWQRALNRHPPRKVDECADDEAVRSDHTRKFEKKGGITLPRFLFCIIGAILSRNVHMSTSIVEE